ncbi:uncharacterized protein LOC132795431 isoform X1 [Drosophila nasuta]|uniref:uncharacterized protein LOC132795431 isoform X1 n=2 Tax=Drosophila nasuta TaxID=42062 RepID=UPI00295E5D50|nr:uncharacterized protein LOC132795431 isoform X1 [Drosophila nasuta]
MRIEPNRIMLGKTKVTSQSLQLVVTLVVIALTLDCVIALPSPMLYKRNPADKFEADLVPVSSTVIPLTVLEVSYGLGGKPSDEYKAAYLRKLRKQVQQKEANSASVLATGEVSELLPAPSDADTLITVKSQQQAAKVKAV